MKLKIDYVFKNALLLLLCLSMTSLAVAQSTVKGTLTDAESGEALIGANVLVVGTSSGTITDFDGTYSVSVPEGSTQLEFSYTGFQTQTVDIAGQSVIDIAMSSGTVLDEVVVVGYGTTTQKQITSAVSSVKEEDFNQGQVNNPVQLIQGKVAGLSISAPGGDPNGGQTIRLRGLNTFGANTEPLVVIDGVIGGSLNTVDPSDIASIDVLKDGSAAAIYGTRASAGVILITTKKGKSGKTKIEYNTTLTTEMIAETLPVADRATYLAEREKAIRNFAAEDATPEDIQSQIDALDASPDGQMTDTDWVDEVTDNSFSQVHNLSLSGGLGGTTYRASFNFRDVNGVGIGTGFDQLNGRLNLTQKALDDRLTVGLNVSATKRESDFGFEEAFRYATVYNPTAPVFFGPNSTSSLVDKYGGYYQSENFDNFNPVAILEQNSNTGERRDLLISLRGDYELVDGLKAGVFYSTQRTNLDNTEYYARNSYFRGFNDGGRAVRYSEDQTNDLFELTGNYNKSFGNTDLDILGGYSYNEIGRDNFRAQASRFISDDTGADNLNFGNLAAQGDPNAVQSSRELYKVIGFFGRANLSIDNTYFLTATVRHEGSTRLGENNKWGTFPSVSAGINFANLADLPSVDNLKLRLAYGVTGALPPESYLSIFRYTRQGSFFFNGNFTPAFGPNRNANPDLKWERKTDINAGLDFALMDYKLTGTFDYYNSTTNDLIYFVGVPVPPNFAPNTWANLEDVELKNSGVELTLTYNMTNADKSFSWEPTVTFGTYETILDTLDVDNAEFSFFQGGSEFFDPLTTPGAPGQNNNAIIGVFGGQEIGQIYGPVYDGLNEDGSFRFVDIDGDGMIETGFGGDDTQVIGNGLPDFSLGFANTFRFNDIDFSFFLRGDFGHDLANMYRNFYESNGNTRYIDNLVQTENYDPNSFGTPQFSSLYVEDASFLTLDNVSIGYRVPLAEGSKFSNLRFSLTGRNLFYITNYSGVDPNVRYTDPGAADNGGFASREFNPSPLAPGIDRRNSYFRTRQFSFGLSVGF